MRTKTGWREGKLCGRVYQRKDGTVLTRDCPTGVATSNPDLTSGLVPSDKKVRVANYQKHTLIAFAELVGAAGEAELGNGVVIVSS